MTNSCLVCNYDNLIDLPYDEFGIASDEIYPCCGFQYGYDDDDAGQEVYGKWLEKWISNGCIWFSRSRKPPYGWNAKTQLRLK